MKKSICFIVILSIFLSGCYRRDRFRPEGNPEHIWICQQPYSEYCWNEDMGFSGKIVVENGEYNVIYSGAHGPRVLVFLEEAVQDGSLYHEDKYMLFGGNAIYEKDKFILTVTDDYKNLFGGELPAMEFIKHDKEEYFKERENDQ